MKKELIEKYRKFQVKAEDLFNSHAKVINELEAELSSYRVKKGKLEKAMNEAREDMNFNEAKKIKKEIDKLVEEINQAYDNLEFAKESLEKGAETKKRKSELNAERQELHVEFRKIKAELIEKQIELKSIHEEELKALEDEYRTEMEAEAELNPLNTYGYFNKLL